MKKKFLDSSIGLITRYKECSKENIEVILYGLESIYLMITKMVVIMILAYILNICKEVLLLLIFYNIIRSQAFGIHASRSSYCLISSIILFIGGALLSQNIKIEIRSTVIISLICNIFLLMYAPADTYKRPLINKKKRIMFKYKSVVLGILYTVIMLLFYEESFINFMLIGMVEATLMVLPMTYKIFNLPYNNYKRYNYNV